MGGCGAAVVQWEGAVKPGSLPILWISTPQAWDQGRILLYDGGRHRQLFTSASFCDPGTVTASSLRMRTCPLQRHGSTGKNSDKGSPASSLRVYKASRVRRDFQPHQPHQLITQGW